LPARQSRASRVEIGAVYSGRVRFGADELRALARKYGALAELRGRRDRGEAGGGEAKLSELRVLAREFPGCLRELDTLGGPELARRAEAVGAAAAGGVREAWMDWICGYHRLMRAALAIRQRRRGDAGTSEADDVVDEAFVAAVLAPPQGRMGIVVLRRLAATYGATAPEIAAALFPLRRPSPYEL
jgi:hypothetical protein